MGQHLDLSRREPRRRRGGRDRVQGDQRGGRRLTARRHAAVRRDRHDALPRERGLAEEAAFTAGSGPSIRIAMDCRTGCGACCIAPSITSPIPGMPHGKPAGIPCVQLLPDMRCALFGRPERPAFCAGLQPSAEMCGCDPADAMRHLAWLEQLTDPD